MKLNNPFVTYGYAGPEYFCDREEETRKLIAAIENERNVTLIAPRRYGKTGLIKNVFAHLPKEYTAIYLDIYSIKDIAAFSDALAHAVVQALETKVEKVATALGKFFKSFRPSITPQSDGSVKFSFDLQSSDARASLDSIFTYLGEKSKDRRIVIAIDEFQQVREFPEQGVEALLRSYIQFLPFVKFIFAGSRRHMMMEMFVSPQGPFYQSTQIMELQVIPETPYCAFAAGFYRKAGRAFKPEVFKKIYAKFSGITWYVQAVLNKIWEIGGALEDEAQVRNAVSTLCGENEATYRTLLISQNEASQDVLLAMARKGLVPAPTSAEFLAACPGRGASTVQAAVKDLLSRDLIYRTDDGYIIYDRLFAEALNNLTTRIMS